MEEQEFRPLGDRIVVKKIEKPQQTPGGIYIPDTAENQEPMEGVVAAIGPGARKDGERTSFHVKEGDRVLFGKWSGEGFEVDGKEYLIMTEENLIGILK